MGFSNNHSGEGHAVMGQVEELLAHFEVRNAGQVVFDVPASMVIVVVDPVL